MDRRIDGINASLADIIWIFSGKSLMTLALSWLAIVVFYRLYLHPLSKFPGPKFAAVSSLYHFYYDVVAGGEMLSNLAELHKVYGSVVRYGPNSVFALSERSAYSDIYRTGTNLTKEPFFYKCFYFTEASFGLQILRSTRRETVIALEVIATYCFGQSFGCLDVPGFRHQLLVNIAIQIQNLWVWKWFPLLPIVLMNLPDFIILRLDPTLHHEDDLKDAHEVIYHHLLHPSSEKHTRPSKSSLLDETHWSYQNQSMPLQSLEKLPYLESLRLSHGVVTALPRVVQKTTRISDYAVPAGVQQIKVKYRSPIKK
ncbi:cytochrome P450 [Armillaria nabsnona]|nr:cytochrome P450 [Armillaria nabsnona]